MQSRPALLDARAQGRTRNIAEHPEAPFTGQAGILLYTIEFSLSLPVSPFLTLHAINPTQEKQCEDESVGRNTFHTLEFSLSLLLSPFLIDARHLLQFVT